MELDNIAKRISV